MNVIICCAAHKRSRCCFSLGDETILERMIRLLHDEGLDEITVAYTLEKPKAEGVNYRKVVYHPPLLSTLVQCKDLISNTLIMLGDIVFSKKILHEVLLQQFEHFLYVVNYMFLVKPTGAIKLENFFDKYGKRIMERERLPSGHGDPGNDFYCIWLLDKPLKANVKMFIPRFFIRDVDDEAELKISKQYVNEYLSKEREPPYRNYFQRTPKNKLFSYCREN